MVLSTVPWENDPCFDWDEYNEAKVWEHGITPIEVEECFENPYRAAPHNKAKAEPGKYESRYRIKGETHGGRKLFIIIQYKGSNVIRPITAFDAAS